MLLGQTEESSGSIFFWSFVLIGLVIAGFFVVSLVRKRLHDTDIQPAAGFSLSDLREMLRKGQITPDEFDKAKEQMIASAKRALERQEAEKKKTTS